MSHVNKGRLMLLALICLLIPMCFQAIPANAQPDLGMSYIRDSDLNLSEADPRDAAVGLIGLLMTFLGIIAVIIILYGGFVWLTAAGNEERVSKAKKIIVAAIIGLIVILASFLIISFVEREITEALDNAAT